MTILMSEASPKSSSSDHPISSPFSSAEAIITAIGQGEIIVLVDDETRENEGDLIVAADFATPAVINFMATHARGLICLAVSSARIDQLQLRPMTTHNECPLETAFTISVDARVGVSTGISAFDRSHTIATLINPAKGSEDLVSPGHMFPLRACSGGVLERRGHTEAAVDLARLAGLTAAGVICEVLAEDGRAASTPELIAFARKMQLKIGTIAAIFAYRASHEGEDRSGA